MCLEFLGSEHERDILLVQFMVNIVRHGLNGVITCHFLYILLSLIAQQSLPKILMQDLTCWLEHGCISMIDQIANERQWLFFEHGFKESILDLDIDVNNALDQWLTFDAEPHRIRNGLCEDVAKIVLDRLVTIESVDLAIVTDGNGQLWLFLSHHHPSPILFLLTFLQSLPRLSLPFLLLFHLILLHLYNVD